MKRNYSIDICKGIAILLVYLGHSILYHPVKMADMYNWCGLLNDSILSFHMAIFFVISGFLFWSSNKSCKQNYINKITKITVPFIFTMSIVTISKIFIPSSLAQNPIDDVNSTLSYIFIYGGDRWFVYVIFIIFMITIPIKNVLKGHLILCSIILLIIMNFFIGNIIPNQFQLRKVIYYLTFFLLGGVYYLNRDTLSHFFLKYRYYIYSVFILTNIVFVRTLRELHFLNMLLALIGCITMISLSLSLAKHISISGDNKFFKCIRYFGQYSLQFYLFTFPYPIIRYFIISVLKVTDPIVIVLCVFVLQIITIGIIVEVGRRIKFLKIPMGY